MKDKFQKDLLKDEQIQWTGQPETSVLFTKADFFLVPFSIIWGGFAFVWEIGVLTTKGPSGNGAPPFMALFGIPFVLMGTYFIIGRFFWKNYRKKKTYYAVTDKRVLVVTEDIGRNVQAEFIDRISTVNKSVGSNGIGTVRFGNSNMMVAIYANTGMEIFSAVYGQDVPTFYDIKEADKVNDLVMKLRNK